MANQETNQSSDASAAADHLYRPPKLFLIPSETQAPEPVDQDDTSIKPTAQDLSPDLSAKELELYLWLHSSRDVKEFQCRVKKEAQNLGFDHYSHSPLAVMTDVLDTFGNLPEGFMERYAKEEFYSDDFVPRHVKNSERILIEDRLCEFLETAPIETDLMKRNIELLNLLNRFDLKRRISVPIHQQDYRAIITLASSGTDKAEFEFNVIKNERRINMLAETIDQVGRHKFNSHFHNSKKVNQAFRIGPRPLQLLELMMKDLSLQEAARVMGISESTAKHHVATGKKVFKAHTLHGLLITVERSGILYS